MSHYELHINTQHLFFENHSSVKSIGECKCLLKSDMKMIIKHTKHPQHRKYQSTKEQTVHINVGLDRTEQC